MNEIKRPLRSMRALALNTMVVLCSFALTVFLCELGVRKYPVGIFETFTKKADTSHEMYIPDRVLGHRPNPLYKGHDERGWRNSATLRTADVVALGDSQTYGLNAEVDAAWPQVLGKTLRKSVYQMAFGGYGPAHFVQMLDEVLQMKPNLVVAALYFGNDILDSYWLTYPVKDFDFQRSRKGEVLDGFLSREPNVLDRLQKLEEVDPFHRRHAFLDCQAPRHIPDLRIQDVYALDALPRPPQAELDEKKIQLYIRKWSGKSWLFRAAWQTWGHLIHSPYVASAPSPIQGEIRPYGPPICLSVQGSGWKTELTPAYRLVTLIDADMRVVEGERISLQSLLHVSERLKKENVGFALVLIPTKEYVFLPYVGSQPYSEGDLRYLRDLWRLEGAMRERFITELSKAGIKVIDSLPYLRRSIAEKAPPYSEGADGHPNANGYRAIAQAVSDGLPRTDSLAGRK